MLRCVFAALRAATLATWSVVAAAGEFGGAVEKEGLLTRDVYAMGGTVVVNATVRGDVTAVGVVVDIGREVSGDILAIGGDINVNSRVLDDVRAAGGRIVLNGQVGDDAVLLGEHVVVDRGAVVNGRGLLAGKTVEIDGRIQRKLHAAAHTVRIRGEITGDADITADRIEIAPGAILRGNLVYTSANDAVVEPGAQILGTVTHSSGDESRWHIPEINGRVFIGVSLFFTATLLTLLLPRVSAEATGRLRHSPWRALGIGMLFFFLAPVIVVLLTLSAVGVWLAVLLMAAVLVAIIGGYVVSIVCLAHIALRELRGNERQPAVLRLAAVALILVLITALSWMPFVYLLATLALIWFGMGALWCAAFSGPDTPLSQARAPSPGVT